MLARMPSLSIVSIDPFVHVSLQLLQTAIELAPERRGVKRILNGLVESLADAGLWALGLATGVIDAFQIEIQGVFVMLPVAAVFAASIRQDSQQWNALLLVPRYQPIVEHVGCRDGVLAVIQLGKRYLAIAIDVGLLVNTTHAFDIAHVIDVLAAQLARVLSFDLAVGWLFFPGFFQCTSLVFGQDQLVLHRFGR